MSNSEPMEVRPSEAERIAYAYRLAAQGNAWAALVRAIEDALRDLAAAERRLQQQERVISRGYVRARLGRR
ncbi:hypothetical protein [Methylobacterium soli]|uniref:Uncharacterized protein n=1 Tax=Methylobacterium soli TaxID=553447 RepID=A0A6L3SUF9_9HYPH|nr:hypothetical protein [Methylobacterium soli]KAB1077260.1 hypothetical protein F6X53_19400 [Methylobacterium soli]GJE44230.1 hypothetical protein AEGHOMDF_3418 [Methylobacterium soli]